MKKPIKSIIDYLLLAFLTSIAILFVLYFNGNKFYQETAIIGYSVLYIVWAIIHHSKEKSMQARIVLEYVLFALLGCIITIGLLK